MRLDRLPEYVTTTVVTLLGMGFALYCGRLSGAGQVSTLAVMITACLLLFVTIKMRSNVWWLIPVTWVMTGRVPILPLPFALRDLCVIFVFGATCALIALKIIRAKPKFDVLDFWMIVCVAYVAIGFVRNPVGTLSMDSDRVGGKPYFDVFIAVLAFWVLSRASAQESTGRRLTIFFSAGPIFQGLLAAVTYWFPVTVPLLAPYYTGISTETYNALDFRNAGNAIESRQSHLFLIGNTLILTLCSFFRPLTLLIPTFWWRFALLFIASVAVLKSGHRTAVVDAGLVFLLASYFRCGIGDVFKMLGVGIPLLALLILLQGTVIQLPQAAQRSLSFLPGKWDPLAVSDARGSSEWRYEMWRIVLSGNKYIENKLFGDGFGFSRREYGAMAAAEQGGDPSQSQESALLVGAYHSGPISAIRYVGVFGLILFLIFLVSIAKRAWVLVRKAEGTRLYPLALFLCLPVIIAPFKYVFVFGGYESALPNAIISLGLLKILGRSLETAAPVLAVSTPARTIGRVGFAPQRHTTPASAPLRSTRSVL